MTFSPGSGAQSPARPGRVGSVSVGRKQSISLFIFAARPPPIVKVIAIQRRRANCKKLAAFRSFLLLFLVGGLLSLSEAVTFMDLVEWIRVREQRIRRDFRLHKRGATFENLASREHDVSVGSGDEAAVVDGLAVRVGGAFGLANGGEVSRRRRVNCVILRQEDGFFDHVGEAP